MPLSWNIRLRRPSIVTAMLTSAAIIVNTTPTLQQAFFSSSNPSGVGGDTGSAFQYTLPAPIGLGNSVIITASYPHGTTASISDNNGNSWGAAAKSVDAGTGNLVLSTWVFVGANAGLTTFELNVGGTAIQPVSWSIEEWNNIIGIDVVAGASSQSGSTLSTGTMTTTVNGDLIRAFYHPAGGIGGNPTSWAAAANWTLMDADIAWNSNQGYPKASQFIVQATKGVTNSTITINGDTGDAFNCVAVALKSGSAGVMYSGIRVLKHMEFTVNALSGSNWKLQLPTLGNLRCWTTSIGSTNIPINSVTDSESNTWQLISWKTDACQGYYLQNSAVNQNLALTIAWGAGASGNGVTCNVYDIGGAAASQPGAVASVDLTNISTSATSAPNQPDITPTQLGSLIIGVMQNQGAGGGNTPANAGTTTGVTSPSALVWAGMTYTGHTGAGQFDFGDGWSILTNNQSLSSLNFTYTVIAIGSNGGGGGNSVAGCAVEFLHA